MKAKTFRALIYDILNPQPVPNNEDYPCNWFSNVALGFVEEARRRGKIDKPVLE